MDYQKEYKLIKKKYLKLKKRLLYSNQIPGGALSASAPSFIPGAAAHSEQIIAEKNGCQSETIDINIKDKLVELNNKLNLKCPNLMISYDPFKMQINLIKMNENKIISYIKLTPFFLEDILRINIDSLTIEGYGGKKYNKFLRSILIIITTILFCENNKKIDFIYSQALNVISAWLLISNFNTDIKITSDYIDPKHPLIKLVDDLNFHNRLEKDGNNTYERERLEVIKNLKSVIFDWYSSKSDVEFLEIFVDNNPTNTKKAEILFDKLLEVGSGIECV
jgi:hypothetical protein